MIRGSSSSWASTTSKALTQAAGSGRTGVRIPRSALRHARGDLPHTHLRHTAGRRRRSGRRFERIVAPRPPRAQRRRAGGTRQMPRARDRRPPDPVSDVARGTTSGRHRPMVASISSILRMRVSASCWWIPSSATVRAAQADGRRHVGAMSVARVSTASAAGAVPGSCQPQTSPTARRRAGS